MLAKRVIESGTLSGKTGAAEMELVDVGEGKRRDEEELRVKSRKGRCVEGNQRYHGIQFNEKFKLWSKIEEGKWLSSWVHSWVGGVDVSISLPYPLSE